MHVLREDRLAELLEPYLVAATPPGADSVLTPSAPDVLYAKLAAYLDLLVRWNERTNLTAIRDPEEMVRRHFGESLFLATHLATALRPGCAVLDYGSGAGFPGVPVQLMWPEVRVTLAESQRKKVSFLREVARSLPLADTRVWDGRVEQMPTEWRFRVVMMRAVDGMAGAKAEARVRSEEGGTLASLEAGSGGDGAIAVPDRRDSWLVLEQQGVPRGTLP